MLIFKNCCVNSNENLMNLAVRLVCMDQILLFQQLEICNTIVQVYGTLFHSM